ncbi:penicillin-binding protein [Bacillus tianshenii]|nr:penicillin-binding protein [Bacillus tianshenii]
MFFILLFFVMIARFLYIQTTKEVQGHSLTAIAQEKWTKQQTIPAHRGKILDRNGLAIAEDSTSYTVFAILDENYSKNAPGTRHVDDPGKVAKKLAPLLKMDVEKLEARLSKDNYEKDPFQVEFGSAGRYIDLELKEKIEALHLPGIYFRPNVIRHYPNGTFASHVIGYAQPNGKGLIEGKMGIEKQYNDIMTGEDGNRTYKSDRKGFRLPDPAEMVNAPEDGNDVYLTLDQKIQTFLEAAVTEMNKQYKPKQIIAIVADPKTGEILGMSTRPSFDPNIRDIENYRNEAIAYRFEPGSTMKAFTLAAAINEGKFPANETFQSGSYKLSSGSRPIHDHNRRGWGKITYLEGIQRSSNVGVAKLVQDKLGTEKFHDYLIRFGFDRKTGIDLPKETAGRILYNYPIEKITTAFGQGTTITPIQQIQAATAIANDGKMMKPYVVKEVVNSNTGKTIKKTEPEVAGEPIKAKTAKEVRDILETVVTSPKGTGTAYKLKDYSVAGKTGTAQIPNPDGPGYLYGHSNYIFSFLGMAPKDDPRLLMYVAVKQPELKGWELGNEPSSYIFKTVMENSLHYLNIEPTEEENQPKVNELKKDGSYSMTVPDLTDKTAKQAQEQLKKEGIESIVLGSGDKVTAQLPYADSQMLKSEKVLLRTSGDATMPDMSGWSIRDVMKVAKLLELKPNVMGSGYVQKQNIRAGATVKQGDFLVVEMSRPNEPKKKEDEKKEEEDLPVEVPEGA